MSREEVYFGGVRLNDYCLVAGVKRGMVGTDVTTHEISGRDGVIIKDVRYTSPEVAVKLVIDDESGRTFREAIHDLTALLLSREVKPLQFTSDNGLYYRAIVSGTPKISELIRTGSMWVNFAVVEPCMYGRTVDGSHQFAGGTLRLAVGGTLPTGVRMTVHGANPELNDTTFELAIGSDYVYRFDIDYSSSGSELGIDTDTRVVTVDGTASILPLDLSWDDVAPGLYEVSITTGSAQSVDYSYTERWL